MHTFQKDNVVFNYNSDLSGDVIISRTDENIGVRIDGQILLDFVADYVLSQKIAKLEDMEGNTAKLLGID